MIYMVGGTVRDLIMGKTPVDLDLAVADAKNTADELCHMTEAGYFILDEERNTVRLLLGKERIQIDIASLQGTSIDEDLGKRDFTINAMAMPVGGENTTPAEDILELVSHLGDARKINATTYPVLDPYGGQNHIKQGLISAVSQKTFSDDPIRLLRAIRFTGQFGFQLTEETAEMIRKQASLLTTTSGERIREEVFLILNQDNTERPIELMSQLGVLEQLLPQLTNARQMWQENGAIHDLYAHSIAAMARLDELNSNNYTPFMSTAIALKRDLETQWVPGRSRFQLLKLASLLHDLGKTASDPSTDADTWSNHATQGAAIARETCQTLVLSRRETATVCRLVENHYRIFEIYRLEKVMGEEVYRLIEETGEDFPLLVLLAWADWQGGKTQGIKREQHFLEFLRFLIRQYYEHYLIIKSKPLLTGEDVMNTLGISPSPLVGEVLAVLRKKQFLRQLDTREAALQFLQERRQI